ncbi:MAG: fumarylacetoacetate hydrolase family protein [Firmicutes bacterium]|nr:fumarylacetoacetate hydrolase family protein [Bacillota bacterium]
MRTVRFQIGEKVSYGLLEERGGERVVTEVSGETPGEFAPTKMVLPLEEVKLLAPVMPSKIVCVGLNYRDHAQEMDLPIPEEPLLFLKPPTAVVGPGDVVVMPPQSQDVQYEAELAFVISRQARKVSPENADKYIWGYTCFNDVTARDLQARDGQWSRAKGFDTFAPLGPWIESEVDPTDLEINCYLNDRRVQHSRTSEFIFSIPEILAYITEVMTLLPGDVVITGTPPGVGPVEDGDRVTVEIEGIGRLMNSFRR